MNAEARRKIEMGIRALEFSDAHPDSDPGYVAAEAKLRQLVARANEAATAQRSGIVDVRAASARKSELRRAMLAVHIAHLAQVGREAALEDHELGQTFKFKPGATTLLAFRTAARTMAAEAEAHRDVLGKHGLAGSVLDEFIQRLDQFDVAVALGNSGRATHTGATSELKVVADGIARAVRLMDGRNRQRFQQDEQLLRAWVGASTVIGQPRRGARTAPEGEVPPAEDGDVRPAA